MRLLQRNDNPAVRLLTLGMGSDGGVALQGGVQNSALIGVHWLKRHALTGLTAAIGHARSQLAQIPEIDINSPQEALPFILNFSCLCIGSEIMLNALDAKGFCVSAQSTCNSKGKAISHVLLAMGKDELHATHAVRLSFSHLTTMAQIDAFIQSLKEIIKDYATR